VSDPSSAVVPDALVEIRDTAKGTLQSAKTVRDGVYHFFFLAPSRYTLTVKHDRFRKRRYSRIEVLVRRFFGNATEQVLCQSGPNDYAEG